MAISDTAYIRRFFSLYSQEEKDKVRGHALYPTDLVQSLLPDDAVHTVVVRSPYPGATFSTIKTEKAEAVRGVLKIITAKDIPNNLPYGKPKKSGAVSQFILAEKAVRYEGEPVALVVAESSAAAKEGASALEIDWKEDPTQEEIVEKTEFSFGDKPAGELEWVETEFKFPSLHSRYLEAEAGWVNFKDKTLTFHIGSLLSESQRVWVSEVLDTDVKNVSAEQSPLGGQFGGRQQRELIIFLALSSWLTSRPAALVFDYEEQDIGSYGYEGCFRVGYDKDSGELGQLTGSLCIDAGSYAGSASRILQKALEHASSVYDFKSIELQGEIKLTPSFPRRALKGEALTAVTWVTEQLVDQIAVALDVDPLEFRNSKLRSGLERVSEVAEEVEKIERPFRLVPKEAPANVWDAKPIVGRGVSYQVFRPTTQKEFDYSEVSIQLLASGSFLIRTSNLTLDLHIKQALAEVAANVLKTHPKAFVVEGMMREVFEEPARRETYPEFYHLAQAVWYAANGLRERMVEAGRHVLQSDDVILKDGAVCDSTASRKKGYRELAFTESTKFDFNYTHRMEEVDKPHGCAAGAVSRVSFDPLTGELRVDSVKVVVDAGPVLYKTGLEIAAETAASWAMAALFSSNVTRAQPIPTALDGPEAVSLFNIDYPLKDYSDKPAEFFGSRGIVDAMMAVVLGSLVTAIQEARGMTLDEIPMSLEFMYPKRKKAQVHFLPFRK